MQPVSWYLNRLSLMTPAEVLWRAANATRDRLGALSPAAVPAPQRAAGQLPPWRPPASADANAYTMAAERTVAGGLELYGEWTETGPHETDWNRDPVTGIRSPRIPGKRLDYRDSRLVGNARNVWEINRHHQFVLLGQAWAVSGEDRYRRACLDQLASWIAQCPYPYGINWASALEHGIRLINWYCAIRLLAVSSGDLDRVPGFWNCLYRHCDFIWSNQSRYSSANNHLIGEMAGLYVAATAWPCWRRSRRWREGAKRILVREAERQVHPDGVLREQTVGYQIFVLELLLIAALVGEANEDPFPSEYWSSVRRMMEFLFSIRDCRGNLPNFGDADEGAAFLLAPNGRHRRSEDLLELGAAWSDRTPPGATGGAAAWLEAGFLRPRHWPAGSMQRRRCFPKGGYYVLGARFGESDEVSIVFDAAPLGFLAIAAHGHADCLSFTLSLAGEPILVDPGTYSYHQEPLWRDYFRSTRAHNTLYVDERDQSQMGGPFMWLRKARPTVECVDLAAPRQCVRARHDGYRTLPDPLTHTRELILDPSAAILDVLDEVQAEAPHRLQRLWHFDSGCMLHRLTDTTVAVQAQRSVLQLTFEAGTELSIHRGSLKPMAGWISPRFGKRIETFTLCATDTRAGRAVLRTRFAWRLSKGPQP